MIKVRKMIQILNFPRHKKKKKKTLHTHTAEWFSCEFFNFKNIFKFKFNFINCKCCMLLLKKTIKTIKNIPVTFSQHNIATAVRELHLVTNNSFSAKQIMV